MFHQTVSIDKTQLDLFEAKAQSQEELIYNLFCEKKVPMSWSEVKGCLEDLNNCSIKRSLTNLCDKEMAIKRKRKFCLLRDENNKMISQDGGVCCRYKLVEINNLNIV